jgi:hypothetical protein
MDQPELCKLKSSLRTRQPNRIRLGRQENAGFVLQDLLLALSRAHILPQSMDLFPPTLPEACPLHPQTIQHPELANHGPDKSLEMPPRVRLRGFPIQYQPDQPQLEVSGAPSPALSD